MKVKALNHINVVVDDMDKAIDFYQRFLGAAPQQRFNKICNEGLNHGVGLEGDVSNLEITVCYLAVPGDPGFTLELMCYENRPGEKVSYQKYSNSMNVLGHIALTVEDVSAAFEWLKTIPEVALISKDASYRPQKISRPNATELEVFDEAQNNPETKEAICDYVAAMKFFYCLDPYGIQWEIEGAA